MQGQFGRSMLEIIAVLAIVSILSIGGIWGYTYSMNTHYINDILEAINFRTVAIADAVQTQKFDSPEKMNAFLSKFSTEVGPYHIRFYASPEEDNFTGKYFYSEITGKDDQPVRGSMCYRLMKTMMEQKLISDIGLTVTDDEDGDGQQETISLRLNGLAVDLDAVCGNDVL